MSGKPRTSCYHCGERKVKCSGPPIGGGSCTRCARKGRTCVFGAKKKPGPKVPPPSSSALTLPSAAASRSAASPAASSKKAAAPSNPSPSGKSPSNTMVEEFDELFSPAIFDDSLPSVEESVSGGPKVSTGAPGGSGYDGGGGRHMAAASSYRSGSALCGGEKLESSACLQESVVGAKVEGLGAMFGGGGGGGGGGSGGGVDSRVIRSGGSGICRGVSAPFHRGAGREPTASMRTLHVGWGRGGEISGVGTPAAPAVHGGTVADSVGKGKAGCWSSRGGGSGAVAGTVRGTSVKRKDMAADDRRGEMLEGHRMKVPSADLLLRLPRRSASINGGHGAGSGNGRGNRSSYEQGGHHNSSVSVPASPYKCVSGDGGGGGFRPPVTFMDNGFRNAVAAAWPSKNRNHVEDRGWSTGRLCDLEEGQSPPALGSGFSADEFISSTTGEKRPFTSELHKQPCLDDATPRHPVKKRRVGHGKGPQHRQSFLPPLDSRRGATVSPEVLAWSSTIAALDKGGVGGVAGVSGGGGGGGGLGTLHADGSQQQQQQRKLSGPFTGAGAGSGIGSSSSSSSGGGSSGSSGGTGYDSVNSGIGSSGYNSGSSSGSGSGGGNVDSLTMDLGLGFSAQSSIHTPPTGDWLAADALFGIAFWGTSDI